MKMKKLLSGISLTLLMTGIWASNALGMTMTAEDPPRINSQYGGREFDIATVTITEDHANELTVGDTFTLALPDGAVWDRDNTRVYRYIDGKLDSEVTEGSHFDYEDDRKMKFSFKMVSGNVESYKIEGSIKLYGFHGDSVSVSLWQTNLSSFSPSQVTVADNKPVDQNESILLSVDGTVPEVTVGSERVSLASIKIAESTLSCFEPEDKITLTLLTSGVIFDDNKDVSPYYYPIMNQHISGDKIFTGAALESKTKAGFQVEEYSEKAASVRVQLRAMTIANDAPLGDIVVKVQAGDKIQEMVVGKIVAKTEAQLNQEALLAEQEEAQKAKIGRSVFTLASAQYTFMDQVYTMPSAPYNVNGNAYVPASILATSLGITPSNYIWNPATNKVSLKSGKIVLEMTLWSTEASLTGTPITLENPPAFVGNTVMLPIREMAEIFGYSVTWAPHTQSIILDPPAAL